MTLLWKAIPVTTLTVRQFMGGRTARLALVLSCLPALFAAIYLARPWNVEPVEFLTGLFTDLIVPTLLPIVVLLPATAAFGEELEDGTLVYLVMKPVTRLRLVLGKYAAVVAIAIPSLLIGIALTTVLVANVEGAESMLALYRAMAAAAAADAALLSAVFVLVSLIIPRALLAGMIYIFVWESLLGRFLPGVESVSSREYTMRVFNGVLDGDSTMAWNAVLTMAIVAIICLALAVWRLRTLQID